MKPSIAGPVLEAERDTRVRVNEIFFSLQGESSRTGLPTVFVRLTGCPLRCRYCDTRYAFHGGHVLSIDQVLADVTSLGGRYVTVTGGEPLAQKSCLRLLKRLCDADFVVSLETSGALDVSAVDTRVMKVMDLKTPNSGEQEKNHYRNIDHLSAKDQVKFVIADRDDYQWAKQTMATLQLSGICEVLFSPSTGEMEPRLLADWIVADNLPVRFQIQLHKYLWGDTPGR